MSEPEAAAPGLATPASGGLRAILSYIGLPLLLAFPIIAGVQMYKDANAPPQKPGPSAALTALAEGDFDRAEVLAKKLSNSKKSQSAKELIQAFAISDRANYKGPAKQKELALKAIEHLKAAQELGLPEEWEPRVQFMHAKNLFRAQRFEECRPLLEEIALHDDAHANEACAMLSKAWRRGARPDLKKALLWNAELLARPEELSDDEKDAAFIELAELKLGSSDTAAAAEALAKLSEDGKTRDEAIVLRARILMAEADALATGEALPDAARAKYKGAVDLLRKLLNRSDPDDPISGDAAYLTGVCRLRLGEVTQALGLLERTHRIYLGQPAALSASLLAADWRLRRDEDALAVTTLVEEMAAFPPAETFEHPSLTLAALRDEIARDFQRLMEKRNFEQAVALAQGAGAVLEPSRAVDLEAQAETAWSNALLERSTPLPNAERMQLVREARRERRKAGDAQLRLAELQRLTQEYARHLWDAVESYRVAEAHTSVIQALRLYFTAEVKRHRPTGLEYLGKALFAKQEHEGALRVLGECIEEYPKADSALSARLISARVLIEKGDIEAAEKLLNDNLYNVGISPASMEWRDTLFEMGRLKYNTGRHAEAIPLLEEAAERYEPMPAAIESRYLAAEAYRRLAAAGAYVEFLGADRPTCLARGLSHYDAALALLKEQYSSAQDPRLHDSLVRNCRFGRGAVLVDLNRTDEAADTYRNLIADYAASPESLPAYVQLANCAARRGRYDEARNILKQAKVNVAHLNLDDAAFKRLSFLGKEEWNQAIDGLIAAGQRSDAPAVEEEETAVPNSSVP